MEEKRVGLAAAISSLRSELADAIRAGEGEELTFEVGQITVELQVSVETNKDAKGGVKFWVVELGGGVGKSQTLTHKLVVPLTPKTPSGGPVRTSRPR